MAGFHTKTFLKYDCYMTPKYAWENIKQYIPNGKVIYEPFYGDGKSGEYLRELGFTVIHEKVDFYENNFQYDIVVSNPPFSDYKRILQRLVELDKPFILILPFSKINTQIVRNLFCNDQRLQLIIPRKRIQFRKLDKDGNLENTNKCNFDCFYYCWKMNLERDITWLL